MVNEYVSIMFYFLTTVSKADKVKCYKINETLEDNFNVIHGHPSTVLHILITVFVFSKLPSSCLNCLF